MVRVLDGNLKLTLLLYSILDGYLGSYWTRTRTRSVFSWSTSYAHGFIRSYIHMLIRPYCTVHTMVYFPILLLLLPIIDSTTDSNHLFPFPFPYSIPSPFPSTFYLQLYYIY